MTRDSNRDAAIRTKHAEQHANDSAPSRKWTAARPDPQSQMRQALRRALADMIKTGRIPAHLHSPQELENCDSKPDADALMVVYADLFTSMGLGSKLMVWVETTHTTSGLRKPRIQRVGKHRPHHKRIYSVLFMAREDTRKTG